MVRTNEFKNPIRLGLIEELEKAARKEDARIWKRVAQALAKSRKNRAQVNLYRINKNTSDGDVIVVPGNVMGSGKISHKVDVYAFKFTNSARKEIISAGGKAQAIPELLKANSKGSGVRIIN